MNLRRQPNAGYAMAALLIAMSIMAIMMTIAMPTWKHLVQREKEAELVFRLEQYGRALVLFQRKNGPGTSPPSVDFLVQQRFLRKKYKDPITNDDFVPLALAANQAGQNSGTGQGGRGATTTQGAQRGSTTARGGTTPGQPVGGIVGFTSKSKDTSIRIYNGRTHYNEWVYTPPPQATAGAGGAQGGAAGATGPGGVGAGGGRGGQRGNQGSPQGPQVPIGGQGQGSPRGGGTTQFPPARGR